MDPTGIPMEHLLNGPIPQPVRVNEQRQHNWAMEFDAVPPNQLEHTQTFEAAFQFPGASKSIVERTSPSQFQPFRPMQPIYPHIQQEMNSAFVGARNGTPIHSEENWAAEFKAAEKRAVEDEPKTVEINEDLSADALSKTAGVIADILDKSGNEKFKNSKFFGLMTEIRDKKVAIEGDKLVEQISPAASGSHALAEEFFGARISQTSWEEDFAMRGEAMNTPNAPPRNWRQEVQDDQLKAQYAPDVSHDMDWSQQIRNIHNLEEDSVLEKKLYEEDWTSEFREKMSLENSPEQEALWKKMEETYDAAFQDTQASTDYTYQFTSNNPYVELSEEVLRSPASHTNLTESILATEALLHKQTDHGSAKDWFELGKKQQENENESAAIAALQRAIQVDSNYLPAYLALAVSQTNENLTNEAYHSLTEWLNRNPKYPDIKFDASTTLSSSDYHDGLIQHLMRAAMSRPGHDLDPEVQTALGVLFNISSEYDKAIDCFQSALSAAPNDYQLWNKLGYC
jgi:peroxin-5